MLLHGAQPAHAVGDADAAQAVNPRVGVGGEARVVLARRPHQPDRALLEQLVQAQHVIAGDAEDVLDPVSGEPVDQVLADREDLGRGSGSILRPAVAGSFRCGRTRHQKPPSWAAGGGSNRTRLVLFQRSSGPTAVAGRGWS